MQFLKELMIGISTKVNLQGLNQGMAGINAKLNNVKMGFQGLNNKISGLEVAGLAVGMVGIIDKAVKFEDHMAGVIKQVNGMRDASGNLTTEYKSMENQIRELAKRSPISANEIADIVTAGARMNVAKEDLMGFTETAMKMATAFEAPAAELTDQMGKISNVFGIPIKSIGGLADTINYLDDNAISKGSDIINVLQRIGGTAKTVGMSAKDAAALGSTFLSLGASAEIAATGSNALMSILATAGTNKSATKGLSALGLNAKAIQKGMVTDATGTIQQVLNKVNALPQVQKLNVLTEIFGREYADDIAKVAGSVGEYRRQLELANGAAATGSMDREYQNKLKTTSAQMEIFKNKAIDVGITLGQALLPPIINIMDKLGPLVSSFGEWAKNNQGLITGIGGLIAGLVGFKLAMAGIGLLFMPISTAITVFSSLRKMTLLLTAAQWLWNAANLANPMVWIVGAIVIGVAALTAGVAYLYTNWDNVKRIAGEVGIAIKDAIGSAIDWVISKIAGIFQAFSDVWNNIKSVFSGGNSLAVNSTVDSTKARQSSPQPSFATASNYPMVQAQQKINASIPAMPQVQATKGYNPTVTAAQAQNSKVAIVNAAQAKQPPQVVKQQSQPNNVTMTNNYTINAATNPQAVSAEIDKRNRVARSYLNGGVAG